MNIVLQRIMFELKVLVRVSERGQFLKCLLCKHEGFGPPTTT